jgi:hypothetical protein
METFIIEKEAPQLNGATLIEGLPGVGLVGKIAVDYMVSELEATKFADLYSPHMLHQALIREKSELELIKNEFYYHKGKKNIILLGGDAQAVDVFGHYEITSKILEYVEQYDVQRIFTLGGFATKEGKNRIFGAMTDPSMVKEYNDLGITFMKDGNIVGAAGLLLGIGKLKGIKGACFLGECPGYLVAPKGAKAVLEVVTRILDIPMDFEKLDQRVKKTEKFLQNIKMLEGTEEEPIEEGYIG